LHYILKNGLRLKHQKFTLLGYTDIGIRTFEFVARAQFLCERAD